MAETPEIPEELLDQILSDPDAVAALQELAARANVHTPVADMARDEQRALVTAMMGLAQQAEAANGAPSGNPADIPDDLIVQVFTDPRADTILRDIMQANQLMGEPANLPDDTKRSIVQLLIDQGVISFEENPS